MIGGYGDISCFSLQGNKAIAGGEAGISLQIIMSITLKCLFLGILIGTKQN